MAQSTELKVVMSAVDQASSELKKVNSTLNSLGSTAKKTAPSFGTLTGAVAAGQAAYQAVTGAIRLVSGALSESVQAAVQAENEWNLVASRISSTGLVFSEVKGVIEEFSDGMAAMGVNDEAAALAVSQLTIKTGNLGEAMKLTKAASDLASSGFGDMEGNVDKFSKILSGRGEGALKSFGISAKGLNTPLEQLDAVLGKITRSTEEYAATSAGQIEIAKVAYENLQETIGGKLAPILTNVLLPVATALISEFDKQAKTVNVNTGQMKLWADAIFRVVNAFAALFNAVRTGISAIVAFGTTMVLSIGGIIGDVSQAVKAFLNTFKNVWESIKSGDFTGAFDAIKNGFNDAFKVDPKRTEEMNRQISAAWSVVGDDAKRTGESIGKVFGASVTNGIKTLGIKDAMEKSMSIKTPKGPQLFVDTEGIEKSAKEVEKLQDSLDDLTSTYVDAKNKIRSELSQLESDHSSKMGDIANSISEVNQKIVELQKSYNTEIQGIHQDTASKIVGIYDQLDDKRAELDKIRSSETTTDSIQRFKTLQAEISKEENFLNSNNEFLLGLQDEIKAVKEFNAKSEAEQAIIIAQQKQAQATEEFNTKINQLNAEKQAFFTKQSEEVAAYNARKEELKKVDEETTKLYQAELDNRAAVTDAYIKAEKTKWEDLKRSIDAAIAAQAKANSQALSVSNTARLSTNVSGKRAAGGTVNANSAYIVGEEGPELFVPGSSGVILPNSKGTAAGISYVVNINGGTYLSESVAEDIGDMIINKLKLAGQKI